MSIRVQVATGSLRMHRHRSDRIRVSVYCGTSRCWITDPTRSPGSAACQVHAVGSREESFPFLSFHCFVLDASGNRECLLSNPYEAYHLCSLRYSLVVALLLVHSLQYIDISFFIRISDIIIYEKRDSAFPCDVVEMQVYRCTTSSRSRA